MTKFPSVFHKFGTHILYFLGIPAFLLAFVLLFKPGYLCDLLSVGSMGFSANLAIVSTIFIFVLALSRVMLYIFRRNIPSLNLYWAWCFLETIVCLLFTSLYLCLLISPKPSYFEMLTKTVEYLLPVIVIPYAILELFYALREREKSAARSDDADVRIKFYDEKHLLKLVVARSAVLFLAAEENYVRIHYAERDKIKSYALRCSMRSLEELCQQNGLLRCHRSYYVSTAHIKLLRKDKEGVIYIELDHPDVQHIPVTKRYYDQISSML